MRIDSFAHIVPRPYLDLVAAQGGTTANLVGTWIRHAPLTESASSRTELLDRYDIDVQVVTPPVPPVDVIAAASGIPVEQLVRTFNDGIAAWVSDQPDRFRGVGTVSLNAIDHAIDEVERLAAHPGFLGVGVACGPDLPQLEAPELDRFYARVEQLGLGIWIHPFESPRGTSAPGTVSARQQAPYILSWPYQTTLAVFCMAAAGIPTRFPRLRWVLHHAGGVTSVLAPRIDTFFTAKWSAVTGLTASDELTVVDALRTFYVDTAAGGSVVAVSAAVDFFGLDHVLFGTDAPFGERDGADVVERAISSVEGAVGDGDERQAMMANNITRMFGTELRAHPADTLRVADANAR